MRPPWPPKYRRRRNGGQTKRFAFRSRQRAASARNVDRAYTFQIYRYDRFRNLLQIIH